MSFPGVYVPTPVNGVEPAGVNISWRSIVGTTVPNYTCPSDAAYNLQPYSNANVPGAPVPGSTATIWARGNYGATAGYEDFDHCRRGNLQEEGLGRECGDCLRPGFRVQLRGRVAGYPRRHLERDAWWPS